MVAQSRLLENRWDDARAATMDEPGKLLYRSNLLGSDKRITNYGGGNTSAKVEETDPLTGEKFRFSGSRVRAVMSAQSSSMALPRFIRTSSTR